MGSLTVFVTRKADRAFCFPQRLAFVTTCWGELCEVCGQSGLALLGRVS